MTNEPNIIISFVAGFVSFISPCVLPLIPSYLSFIGGVSVSNLNEDRRARTRVAIRSLFFVLGFSIIFVALGALFSGSRLFLLVRGATRVLNIAAGSLIIVLGLNIIFDFWRLLNLERRFHVRKRPRGYLGATLAGMAFGAGWSPCIGPLLTAILFLAGQSGQLGTGILYLSSYSLGLGLPFIAAGLFFPLFERLSKRMRGRLKSVRIGSGILLVAIGVLIAIGELRRLNSTLVAWGRNLADWSAAYMDAARLIPALVLIAIGLIPFIIAGLYIVARRHRNTDAQNTQRPFFSPFRLTFLGISLLLAGLQGFGVVQITELVAAWLSFSGI